MSKLTIQDIARISNVSVSTVSRVLNNHPAVSVKAREEVMRVINELNYKPNKLARSLSSDGFDAILVVYTRPSKLAIDNPYFNTIVSAIGSVAEENSFDLILQSSSNEEKEVSKTLSMIADKLIKGVILLSSRVDDLLIEALSKENIPVVVIGKYPRTKKNSNIFSVDTDNLKDSYNVCKFLIDSGHKEIACIHAPMKHFVSLDRVKGFSNALKDNDLEVNKDFFIDGGHTFDSAYEAALKLLCVEKTITAIFATDDIKALGVYQAAKQLSLNIPNDISVTGYNDYIYSKMITPPLSTVKVPIHDLGIVATTKLIKAIKNKTYELDCVLPTEFKRRSSVFEIV